MKKENSKNTLIIVLEAVLIASTIAYLIGYSTMMSQMQSNPDVTPKAPLVMIIGMVLAIGIGIASTWLMFVKANKAGWLAIIPIVNTIILQEITFGRKTAFLRLLIPIYNIYWVIKSMLELAKRFGKGTAFGVGLIFLTPFFELILGFDDSVYTAPENPEAGAKQLW